MTQKRTFNHPERLFFEGFSRTFKSLETWLDEAYPIYKTRELNRLSDEEILNNTNDDVIYLIKTSKLTKIELFDAMYFSLKDHDDNDLTDIHIPFQGRMSTLSYCPNYYLDKAPRILAEVYNVKDAKRYDPLLNWAGTGFKTHASMENVIMLLFKDDEVDQIESTLNQLQEVLALTNQVIQSYEDKWYPILSEAIEEKRAKIRKKQAVLDRLNIQKAELAKPVLPPDIVSIRYDNDFSTVTILFNDASEVSATFSKTSKQALAYMHAQHNEGRFRIPQQEITNSVGSSQPKLRELFKQTLKGKTRIHPFFNQIIHHDGKGNYWLFNPNNSLNSRDRSKNSRD